MKLSTKGRYGVKAMVDLAIHYGENPISIKSIAERQKISECYLEQLFASLRKAKLIKSIRGAQGGYVLNKSPKDITVADIMGVLEGPIEISDCVEEEGFCSNKGACPTRVLWMRIKESLDNIMQTTTLEDMLADYKKMNKQNKRGVKDE